MAVRKKPSARTERRANERALASLVARREKLASLEHGGAPERPLEVMSASLVEPRALAFGCLRCDAIAGALDEHRAETIAGHALRVVVVRCRLCGMRRTLFFRVAAALDN